jgi:hypothetical protein
MSQWLLIGYFEKSGIRESWDKKIKEESGDLFVDRETIQEHSVRSQKRGFAQR